MADFFESLHPDAAAWFRDRFGEPTEAQRACVPRLLAGRSVLLSSPTGSGKTLAGFFGILDALLREHHDGGLPRQAIRAIYVSPLRALAYDIEKNLREPLRGLGLEGVVRVALRTGDTTAAERQRQRRQPPHILVTTPESLAIVLPQTGWHEALAGCRFVIVDELHAFAETKRGSHLAVSLERLEQIVNPTNDPARRLVRIGLSATVAPLDTVGQFLMGCRSGPCDIVEARMERPSLLEVLTPLRKDPYPPAGYTATRVIRDMADIVARNATTLIFTNTRSGAERISHRLKLALPDLADRIECHHSSLDRDVRLEVEDRLKDGALRAIVCSTSLELGIDIGHVDTVILVSTPKGISRTLQRVGRSGHSIHQRSHGVLVATNINDLIECVVCADLTQRRQLDPVVIFENAADVIAQHIVGMAMMPGGISSDEAFATLTAAYPFRQLPRDSFDRIVRYLEGGGASLERQYRETFGKIVDRDGRWHTPDKRVERDYLLNIGTIHADGMVLVLLHRRRLGSVEEDFVKGLRLGDIFVLGGKTVRFTAAGSGEIHVEPAPGRLPTVPTWNAHKIPLASGLAREVAALRSEVDRRLSDPDATPETVADWLVERWTISPSNAAAIVEHFQNQRLISLVPTAERVLIEAYRDEQDDPERVHYFFHTLIGRSANDALSRILSQRVQQAVGGNALVTIDDYGFLLTLRTFQAMEGDDWRELFRPEGANDDLRAALEDSQLVKWQFGGIAQTGLMVPRQLPGESRALRQVRWSAEILFQVISRHEPDHPLLEQARREAMHTFLDVDRAIDFLHTAAGFEWCYVEVPAVTPFAFGIYASKIRESMMLEDPEQAIERLYQAMREKLGR